MMPSDERDQFLSELYTKYMDDLVRYCRAYVEYNTEYYDLIFDVIQDTFLAANIEYEKLKDHPHIEGWLYKACRFRLTNAIKTYRRKKKRHAFSMDQKGMELPDTACSIMVPGNQTGKYTKDCEHGKMGIEERRSNHATQCVHTGVQSKDRHRGA